MQTNRALKAGDILDFGVHMFGDRRLPKKVLVRECYTDLLALVLQITGRNKLKDLQASSPLILGTPGIGKSFFGYFLVPALFLQGEDVKTIIYESGPKQFLFLFLRTKVLVGSRNDFRQYLQDPSSFYIADSCAPCSVPRKLSSSLHH